MTRAHARLGRGIIEQIAGLEAQDDELRTAGVEKVFSERVSSVAKREQLEGCPRLLPQRGTCSS